jgi:5-formyltetrahydrofolate cyclo-ligase
MGFYDATLPDVSPPATSVIVIYDFQLLGELPELEHDVACSCVVTDRRSFFPSSSGAFVVSD